jgi:SAM-dependent methyltransferase
MARAPDLTFEEKIGFTDGYREGYEHLVIEELKQYTKIKDGYKSVIDIGCGCGRLVYDIVELFYRYGSHLYLVDSKEVLSAIDIRLPHIKVAGEFPGVKLPKADIVIVNSVLQHVYNKDGEKAVNHFIMSAVKLLLDGGELFLGDIPNFYKRDGADFRYKSFIADMIYRYSNYGYRVFILPHDRSHPLYNTRENISIRKS